MCCKSVMLTFRKRFGLARIFMNAENGTEKESILLERMAVLIRQNGLLLPGARVVVGVSGGVDSVVLLHVLHRLGYEVIGAHGNYHLRGDESDRDEAHVRALCSDLRIPLHVASFDTRSVSEATGRSIQETARDLRYDFFFELAGQTGAGAVAVAHHADDQAETILLNLFRGTGPEGLAGMPLSRPLRERSPIHLIRPLLTSSRSDIEAYAQSASITWREDRSNESMKYRRGIIRHAILPEVYRHFGPAARDNILRAASLQRAFVESTIRPEYEALWEACARTTHVGGYLLIDPLFDQPRVFREGLFLVALRRWMPDVPQNAGLAERIEGLRTSQPGRRIDVPGGAVWRGRDRLVFARESLPPALPQHLSPGETVTFTGGSITCEVLFERPKRLDEGSPSTLYADADRLTFPLLVDRWQPGDRFQPLGMAGTKRISDFLTDEKAPPESRKHVPVIRSEGRIVAVTGYRISDDVRIRTTTERFAKITYIPTPLSGTESPGLPSDDGNP